MAVKSFSFASPGVFLNEIDQSQVAREPAPVGPIIIGRAERGPAMRPVTVASYEEFVATFGEPVAGGNSGGDIWRSGVPIGPTYAPYAAQAWLANNPTVTFIRLLGTQGTSVPTTQPGWKTNTLSTQNGSHGLFVFNSSSFASGPVTGTLAAIWYCNGVVPVLSGTIITTNTSVASNGAFINSDASGKFTVLMTGSTALGVDFNTRKTFSFDSSNGDFVRKSFNTNPVATNTSSAGIGPLSSSYYGYWLGESFENELVSNGITSLSSNLVGIIVPLKNFSSRQDAASDDYAARTGWIISQADGGAISGFNPVTNTRKLFRLIAHDSGEWNRNNIKVTINNIVPPQNEAQLYGTFDVEIRNIADTDTNKIVLESFTNCNLDQTSPNFVARKIGDTKYSWDETNRRLDSVGTYTNNSKYVRVEMYDPTGYVKNTDLPFGVLGPLKLKTVTGSNITDILGGTGNFVASSSNCFSYSATSSTGSYAGSFVLKFPDSQLRVSSSDGGIANFRLADFGAASTKNASSLLVNNDLSDLLRLPPYGQSEFTAGSANTALEHSWVFTLDEVSSSAGAGVLTVSNSTQFVRVSGSKASGSANPSFTTSGSYVDLLNLGVNSFTTLLQGGADGFDVTRNEPLANSIIGTSDTSSFVYYSVRRAIDTVSDPEQVQGNIVTVPGMSSDALSTYLLDVARNRGDCLAVIDISQDGTKSSYISTYEDSTISGDRCASVTTVATRIKTNSYNNSYGATYYPWVQISDSSTGRIVAVPPSVPAIGAMSYTDKVQAPWFAPAGFNRGGLSTGNAGVSVVNVVKKLNQTDRDNLYLVNINPITSFPNEGIVIFGQKTLQATPSALDRINVRRLMLYIKRGINIISNAILFEPNVENTWNNFKDQAEPFLADVKARYGLEDYRLILDSTTTTPDLVDQNIMYAKIFLKPARAIEFIAIDFYITRSGATFNA